ncbi:MAG: hypothetical protein R3264_15145, partial [Anaerolineae bacterium]|nr:hypothetical protein [Anaerolineae bacterium]
DEMAEVNLQYLSGHEIRANKTIFKGNDVVFARIEPCIYNRKIALIPPEVDEALGSTELFVARAKEGKALPEFLLWLLRSELVQRQIQGHMTGTTGRRRLPPQAFTQLKFPKISLELQKDIAKECSHYRNRAKALRIEAQDDVETAKARVERLILGEESLP